VRATVNAIHQELNVKPRKFERELKMLLQFATKCYQPIGRQICK